MDGRFENYKPTYSLVVNKYVNLVGASYDSRQIYYQITGDMANAKVTSGSYVGYNFVKVAETGKGYKTYEYTSPKSHPSQYQEFAYPFHRDNNVDAYRGTLSAEIHYQGFNTKDTTYLYDPNGNIIPDQYSVNDVPKYFPKSSISYTYDYSVDSLATSYLVAPNLACPYFQFYNSYQSDTSATMMINCPLGTQGLPNCNSFTVSSCGTTFSVKNLNHLNVWRKLNRKTTYQFEYGNTLLSQKTIKLTEDYKYNTANRMISEKTLSTVEGGRTIEDVTKYYYSAGPYPSNIFSPAELVKIEANRDYNRVNDLIFIEATEAIKDENSVELSSQLKGQKKVTFSNPRHHIFEVSSVSSRQSIQDSFVDDVSVLRTDDYGNVLEYSTADGVNHVHLYGYHGSVLVATVQNATYNQVVSGINLDDIEKPEKPNGSSNAIESALTAIRTNLDLNHVFVTTYHYDEQMNLKDVIDPNGLPTSYRYDDFGRLLYVVDHNGNMLEEIKYGYRK